MVLMIDYRGVTLCLYLAKPTRLAIRVQAESFVEWSFLVESIIKEDGVGFLTAFHYKYYIEVETI